MTGRAGVRRVGGDAVKAQSLGHALSTLRRAKRLSQREAGRRLGVTAQAWSKYERGQCAGIVTPSVLANLEAALGCEPGSLAAACPDAPMHAPCEVRPVVGGYEIALDLRQLAQADVLLLRITGASA
jgi:transcriptional regulator with XRE-family HTH domain